VTTQEPHTYLTIPSPYFLHSLCLSGVSKKNIDYGIERLLIILASSVLSRIDVVNRCTEGP
jgi:hypothetical protein